MPIRDVLWIDDEIEDGNPAVLLLAEAGFPVACARTADEAIRKCRSKQFSCVVLDLRLTEVPGIAVLGLLRGRGVTCPVMVLTGYPDDFDAAAWPVLGVTAVYSKPLIGDRLIQAVSDCVTVPVAALGPGERDSPLDDCLRTLVNPVSTASEFARAADDLRSLLVSEAPLDNQPVPQCVLSATSSRILVSMQALIATGGRPSEVDVAREIGLSPSRIGHLLREETGRTFRAWRSLLDLREPIRQLALGEEHIAQIAYNAAFVEHPAQFSREFRRVFGLSPRAFRQWYRSEYR